MSETSKPKPGVRAIVTDIEGTTSSIAFVKDVLFPFARERLPAFIETHADDSQVQHWLHEAAKEAGYIEASRTEVIDLLQRWIDEDRKTTPLKALQGMIWKEGYESGAYRAHIYPEVAVKLREWKSRGLKLYVYSSGSVAAQKLFFGFSEVGNLMPLFDGYFDTEIGGKRERGSYLRIAEAIGESPQHILFLSDIESELDAARGAGLQTIKVCRPPDVCAGERHRCVADFDAIDV
ncbi:MAG: acireductone synthase [Rhodanobacteraceae bacterium]|nr:acireductone synthase [Pseudomonadota bacterium]